MALSLAWWGCLMAGGKARAEVIGEDDRTFLPRSRAQTYSGVGQVICTSPSGKTSATTMTLVGDRSTVIGVGHYRRDLANEQSFALDDCQFVLVDRGGTIVFQSSFIGERLAADANRYLENLVEVPDWSVLKLETNAPPWAQPVRLHPLTPSALEAQSHVFAVAFHSAGRRYKLKKLWSPGCVPQSVAGHPYVFLHSCDVSPGSSGGLIFSADAPAVAIGMINGFSHRFEKNYGHSFSAELIQQLGKPLEAAGR